MMYWVFYDLCGLYIIVVLSYMVIVAGRITLGQTNKSSGGCISLKVLEHDEEHKKVHKIYLVAAVGE